MYGMQQGGGGSKFEFFVYVIYGWHRLTMFRLFIDRGDATMGPGGTWQPHVHK